MLINYNIMGSVKYNDTNISATMRIRNLTTGYVSNTYETEVGYYSVNLTNFENIRFNNGDLLTIEFTKQIGDTTLFSRIYHIVNVTFDSVDIDVTLHDDWDYTSDINLNIDNDTVDVTFVTNYYEKIVYRVYYKYDDVYHKILSRITTNQQVTLTFNFNGNYKIIAYVIGNNDEMLSYSEKEFDIDIDGQDSANKEYISLPIVEWE